MQALVVVSRRNQSGRGGEHERQQHSEPQGKAGEVKLEFLAENGAQHLVVSKWAPEVEYILHFWSPFRDDKMLRAILRKEFQFHLAGFSLRLGMLLTLVLAASSTLIAARDYNQRLHDSQDRAAAHTRALREETVYSFLQPVAVRPPEPLGVFDQGFDAHLGNEVAIHLFSIPVEATGGYRGNEFLGASPAADLTTIVAVVLGLLALLLAHDALQAERNSGNLSALLAFGVPRHTLLAGKILGGLLAL